MGYEAVEISKAVQRGGGTRLAGSSDNIIEKIHY